MTDLAPAVRTVVRRCLAVQPGENVVVVVDSTLRDVGEALRAEAEGAQADAVLAVMAPRSENGEAVLKLKSLGSTATPKLRNRLATIRRATKPFG